MKKITTFEAACILCGYGVGGTIMTMPYLATKAGVLPAAIILVLSYLIGMLIAAYTADIALKARSITGHECQVLTQFELFLFNGPLKKILTIIYFVFLALIAVSNLAAYVSESGQLVAALLPVTEKIGSVIFYIFAALVVVAGLKGVAIGERAMVILMFVILAVLAVPSFSHFS
jgi:amino acid permease